MSNNKEKGYLYCLYNKCFESYGVCVFKLGRTKNLKQRLAYYTTSYVDSSHFVAISSRPFENSRKAESILFYLLRRWRISQKREFFQVPSVRVSYLFDRMSNLSDRVLDEIYEQILRKVCPDDILDDVLDTDQEPGWFTKAIEYKTWLDDFFEQFRFKPKDPERYKPYGYKPIEDQELTSQVIQAGKKIRIEQDLSQSISCI